MDAKAWDKIAPVYFDEIASPFSEGVVNPLYKELEALPNKKKLHVADLGCGIGNLTPYLAERFLHVTAMDFSKKMVEMTALRCKDANNVTVIEQDLRDLSEFKNTFNVSVAVNSILMPSLVDVRTAFRQVYLATKKGGMFFGVFPSMNSDLYRALITFEHELSQVNDEKKAMALARERVGEEQFDFLFGFYDSDGRQKSFYQFELEHLLMQVGFSNVTFGKVLYPWEQCEDPSLRKLNKPKLYDWFVKATK